MDITEELVKLALVGAEWVLWLLMALSVFSVGVMIERGLFFHKRRLDAAALEKGATKAIADDEDLDQSLATAPAMAAQVAAIGVGHRAAGPDAAAEAMNSEKLHQRQQYEQNLVVLGTLGNNAPFIGLFGTVLGIIKVFHALNANPEGGPKVVMAGVSEALVATAVGLIVALPAVVAFNFFNRRVRAAIGETDAVAHVILGKLYQPKGGA